MAPTSQDLSTTGTDGRPEPFAHVHAEKQALYRAILAVFSEAKQRFVVHLRPDDVVERLTGPHADTEAVPPHSTSSLTGATCAPPRHQQRHDGRGLHPPTPHALTPHGEAAQTALAVYADALGRRGQLQAVALADLRVGLRTLERLAIDPRRRPSPTAVAPRSRPPAAIGSVSAAPMST